MISYTQYKTMFSQTLFGSVAVIWSAFQARVGVLRIFLSSPGSSAEKKACSSFPGAGNGSCSEIDILCSNMSAFLNGEKVIFSLDILRLDLYPSFQQQVLRTESMIPYGQVSTYQHLAVRLGKPGASRAVGNALARNPFPVVVPCHRTVRSDMSLGGYQGGAEMKRILLENEGIRFDEKGRITSADFIY